MSTIEKATEEFVAVVIGTEQYQQYREQKEKIKQWPELKEKLDEFRIRNFELQNEIKDSFHLYEALENLKREYEPLIEDSRVQKFLDTESALCRLLQKINEDIVGSIGFE